jgi:hypothetical protein
MTSRHTPATPFLLLTGLVVAWHDCPAHHEPPPTATTSHVELRGYERLDAEADAADASRAVVPGGGRFGSAEVTLGAMTGTATGTVA